VATAARALPVIILGNMTGGNGSFRIPYQAKEVTSSWGIAREPMTGSPSLRAPKTCSSCSIATERPAQSEGTCGSFCGGLHEGKTLHRVLKKLAGRVRTRFLGGVVARVNARSQA
jgi:hypothetical protein